MGEASEQYIPRSDAAIMARKGGLLGSLVGAVATVDETLRLGIDALNSQPIEDNLTKAVAAVAITSFMLATSIKGPRIIDNLLDRHTS